MPTDAVSVIDGGSAEHWVVVPESVKARKAEIKTALDAAQKLSEAWKQRGFASRTPYHVSFRALFRPIDTNPVWVPETAHRVPLAGSARPCVPLALFRSRRPQPSKATDKDAHLHGRRG